MNGLEPWDVAALVALIGFKMVPGVALALYYRLDWWTQFLLTGLGGSLGIIFFTYLGAGIGRLWTRLRGKRPSAQPMESTWKGRLWLRYGLWGTALSARRSAQHLPWLLVPIACGSFASTCRSFGPGR